MRKIKNIIIGILLVGILFINSGCCFALGAAAGIGASELIHHHHH